MDLSPLRDQVPWAYYNYEMITPIWPFGMMSPSSSRSYNPKTNENISPKVVTCGWVNTQKTKYPKDLNSKTKLTCPQKLWCLGKKIPKAFRAKPKDFVRWESSLNHAAAVREIDPAAAFFLNEQQHFPRKSCWSSWAGGFFIAYSEWLYTLHPVPGGENWPNPTYDCTYWDRFDWRGR